MNKMQMQASIRNVLRSVRRLSITAIPFGLQNMLCRCCRSRQSAEKHPLKKDNQRSL
jgi:hypothetical protein